MARIGAVLARGWTVTSMVPKPAACRSRTIVERSCQENGTSRKRGGSLGKASATAS
jgi:hypothetical protein